MGNGFLYSNGTTQALTSLLPGSSGWTNLNATAINDSGQIAGQGTYDGQQVAFLMTPSAETPEPGAGHLGARFSVRGSEADRRPCMPRSCFPVIAILPSFPSPTKGAGIENRHRFLALLPPDENGRVDPAARTTPMSLFRPMTRSMRRGRPRYRRWCSRRRTRRRRETGSGPLPRALLRRLGQLRPERAGAVDRKRLAPYGMHPRGGVNARLAAGDGVPSLINRSAGRTPQREGWNP